MRDYENLDVSLDGDVFRIAFDRPDNRNAVNQDLYEELRFVFKDAYESDARVVLFTGNGGAFSAGGDVKQFKERNENPEKFPPFEENAFQGEEIVENLVNLEIPIIAKINGDAVGFGMSLALLCDIVIAAEGARMGDPHVNVGLSTPIAPIIWPLLTDYHTANEMLLTGELISTEKAEELGLINRAVPPEELDEEVDELIDDIASGSQTAIRYSNIVMNKWLQFSSDLMLREALVMEALSQKQPDHVEAAEAFSEGRKPEFPSGRLGDE